MVKPRVLLFIAFVVMLGVKVVLAEGDKVVIVTDVLFNSVEGVVKFAGKVALVDG